MSDVGGSSEGSTTGGLGSSTGRVERCANEETCAPPPPPEWNGPVIARVAKDTQPDPVCPPATTELWEGGQDPAAACPCDECSPESVSCDIVLDWGVFGFCDGGSTDWEAGCQDFAAESDGQFYFALDIGLADGAACTPPTPSDPRFRTRAVVCDPQGERCDGGTCVSGPVCIWRDGEHECPGTFAARTVLHQDVQTKSASCAGCNCGQGSALCEEATISLHEDEACGGEPLAVPDEYGSSSCAPYEDESSPTVLIENIASIDIQPAEFDCGSSLGTIAASATFVEMMPRTLCCG